MKVEITPETIKIVAEGIREFNRGLPTTEAYVAAGEVRSVLPKEYHDDQWMSAVAYGLQKAANHG